MATSASAAATLKEGRARIYTPRSATGEVFYNPVQVFNRDLSVVMMRVFADRFLAERTSDKVSRKLRGVPYEDGLTCLEALSASGLRSMRYALEVPQFGTITANDFDPAAVKAIQANAALNDLPEGKINANHGDASLVCLQHKVDKFHVVDLDPYGAPTDFLDGAVQAVWDHGLLAVTCTDMGVLCGSKDQANCFAKYGGVPLKAPWCHEMGLRLVLGSLVQHAARYKRAIQPVLSVSADFYCRVFVRVFDSPEQSLLAGTHLSHVYMCTTCDAWLMRPLLDQIVDPKNPRSKKFLPAHHQGIPERCQHCGGRFRVGGPAYNGALHDADWVTDAIAVVAAAEAEANLATAKRLNGVLSICRDELATPFFWDPASMARRLSCTVPTAGGFQSALLNAGYSVSRSHTNKMAVKTDAPADVVWDVMRCHVQQHPVARHKQPAGERILAAAPKLMASFKPHPRANRSTARHGVVAFPPNPERNWGPKKRARGVSGADLPSSDGGDGAAAPSSAKKSKAQ